VPRKREDEEEARFLAQYRPEDYPRPAVTVDIVVLTIVDAELRVLLIKRNEHPFKGKWALPGGFVRVGDARRDQGEDIEDAARRELHEETGLPLGSVWVEQLRAFGRPGRDPRMRVVSVAYYALVRPTLAPFVQAGGDAAHARWVILRDAQKDTLAFDHGAILETALARVRDRLDESRIAFELVPETFTIPELRTVHSIIKGAPQDPGNFRKRFNRMLEEGVIELAPGKRITTSKPAKVYRFARG
jgi:8-oxo-dGTP diphosphatase